MIASPTRNGTNNSAIPTGKEEGFENTDKEESGNGPTNEQPQKGTSQAGQTHGHSGAFVLNDRTKTERITWIEFPPALRAAVLIQPAKVVAAGEAVHQRFACNGHIVTLGSALDV